MPKHNKFQKTVSHINVQVLICNAQPGFCLALTLEFEVIDLLQMSWVERR
jgi:hypothetical protein